jgi:hypothetical protein
MFKHTKKLLLVNILPLVINTINFDIKFLGIRLHDSIHRCHINLNINFLQLNQIELCHLSRLQSIQFHLSCVIRCILDFQFQVILELNEYLKFYLTYVILSHPEIATK